MQYVIGGVFALLVLALALGAITGKVQARSCCAPANPELDRRMRVGTPSGVEPGVGQETADAEGGYQRPAIEGDEPAGAAVTPER